MQMKAFIQDYRQFGGAWRCWMILLQLVNLVAPLLLITHPEAWVVLAGYGFAVVVISPLYRRFGWVRLLGAAHFSWFVILPWIAVRYAETSPDGFFGLWLLSVLVVDGICLVIDVVDVLRYLAGERRPVVSARDG